MDVRRADLAFPSVSYEGSFGNPFGSRVSPANTPRQANIMSDVHHPMRNLISPINGDATSGFVSMSDMFSDVCMFVTLMLHI
jgi:hypothetical protein